MTLGSTCYTAHFYFFVTFYSGTNLYFFVFWNLLLYNKLIPIRTARPLSSVQSGPPESPWQVSCTKVFCWSPNLPKTIIECISLPHHQVITWPPRIKLLFFDMFFNVSGTFDTLNEPVLKIYEAKIWDLAVYLKRFSPLFLFVSSSSFSSFENS